jgi:hypothetical protein
MSLVQIKPLQSILLSYEQVSLPATIRICTGIVRRRLGSACLRLCFLNSLAGAHEIVFNRTRIQGSGCHCPETVVFEAGAAAVLNKRICNDFESPRD